MALELTITNEQQVPVVLSPKTAAGHPAAVEGVPLWTVESGDATVIPSEDGMAAMLVSGAVGDSQIAVSADADLGEGVTTISGTIVLHVNAPMAEGLGLIAGTPELKPGA